jgi:hypothetical protein
MCGVWRSWEFLRDVKKHGDPNVYQRGRRRQRGPLEWGNLAGMKWRRGILLAGIHLAVAVPLMVMHEVRYEAFVHEDHADREDHAPPAWIASDPVLKTAPSGDEEQTVGFSPCNLWADYPADEELARSANLPATILSGWGEECPTRWTLAGRLNVGYSFFPSRATISSRREVDCGFGLLVAAQWILVGTFPFTHPKRWWAEPGAFITACAVIAFPFALIWPNDHIARLPVLLAMLAWFWWFGLLLWSAARFGWKRFVKRSS